MRNVREGRREGNGSRRLPADQKVDDERRDAWCDERVAPSGRRESQQRHQRQLSVRASRCGGAGGESQTRPETVSDGGGDERHRCERARRRGGDRRGRRAADGRDELAGPARILLPEGHRQPDAVAGCDDESQHERRADDRPAARALFFVHGARSVCRLPGRRRRAERDPAVSRRLTGRDRRCYNAPRAETPRRAFPVRPSGKGGNQGGE